MKMRRAVAIGLTASLLSFAPVAGAGEPPKQNHHCKMPDGTMDMAKTHKECTTAKGKWVKDAPTAGEAKPGEAKPAEPKPAEAKPAEPKPAPAPAPAK
jgi:hypothetical protein